MKNAEIFKEATLQERINLIINILGFDDMRWHLLFFRCKMRTKFRTIFKSKKHWYQIKYKYYNQNGVDIFNQYVMIGVDKQSFMLDVKWLKKQYLPLHLISGIDKSWLCNGYLDVEIHCYLGKFKKSNKAYGAKR